MKILKNISKCIPILKFKILGCNDLILKCGWGCYHSI